MKHTSILHNFSITKWENVISKLILKYTKEGHKRRKSAANCEFIQLDLDKMKQFNRKSFNDVFNVRTLAIEKLTMQWKKDCLHLLKIKGSLPFLLYGSCLGQPSNLASSIFSDIIDIWSKLFLYRKVKLANILIFIRVRILHVIIH